MNDNVLITAKKIQCCIKQGLTPEDVMSKYQCSKEELKECLKHLYKAGDGSKAQIIYGQLEANRKKPKRKHAKETIAKSDDKATKKPTEDTDVSSIEVQPEVSVANTSETEVQPEVSVANTPETEVEPSLEELKKEEGSLSSEVMELESEHKELSSKHRACITDLRVLDARMEEIKKSLHNCQLAYTEITTRADKIAEEMNDICIVRKDKKQALEKLREIIEEKSMVTIFVTDSGVIEASDNPEFVLDDTGYEVLKAEIGDREECQNLRVREVTTLARLLKITEKTVKVNLICDSQELETAFKALRNQ